MSWSSGIYEPIKDHTQEKSYLVQNQDVRGVGEPYAVPATFREASLPVDPTKIYGSVTTLSMAAIPSPLIGKYIQLPDGTLATPALSWASDTDSGFYKIATDRYGYSVNGVLELEINTSGILIPDLTVNRVVLAGTGGQLRDDADLTYSTGTNLFTANSRAIIGVDLQVGTATDSDTAGDVVFGLLNASRLFFDVSTQSLFQYDSSNNADFKINVAGDSWYNGSGNFGFGTTSPDTKVEITSSTGRQLRLSHTDSNNSYVLFGADSSGNLYIDPWTAAIIMNTSSGDSANGPVFFECTCTDDGNAKYEAATLGAGDAVLELAVNTATTTWSVGVDNSDSDKFKISSSGTLGTNDRLTMTVDGYTTMTPGVLATGTAHAFQVTGPINTGGTSGLFKLLASASTGQTASTEIRFAFLDLSAITTWATGALTNERAVYIAAPTLAFAGASTVTNAATVYIDRAPQAGTNATITNAYALWVDAGDVRFDGAIIGGSITISGLTAGRVTFATTGGALTDDSGLTYDSTNDALTVGAARFHTTATGNLFIGLTAGNFTVTGTVNTGLGGGALQNITSGEKNVAVGFESLLNLTDGVNNVACGYQALYTNTGDFNTAVGYSAMHFNEAGDSNTAIGNGCLYKNTSGQNNTAGGVHALFENQTGSNNTAFGEYCLEMNTVSSNSAFGINGLRSVTTGTSNTAIGFQAGYNSGTALETIDSCVFVGHNATSTTNGLSNAIAIGAGAQVTASNQIMLGNSSITATLLRADVGIGTLTPRRNLDVLDTAAAQIRATYTDNSVYTDLLTDSSGYFNITPSAHITALVNGTAAQRLRVYGTTTGPRYYDIYHSGTQAIIFTNTTDDLVFSVNGSSGFWKLGGSTGHLLAVTDATNDIGADGATRPRSGYFSTSLIAPVVGTNSSTNLTLRTNSTSRWALIGSSGHLVASTNNTYDIGLGNHSFAPRTGYFATSLLVGAANGQAITTAYVTELTTIAAAATTDTAIQIPVDAVVYAVSVRVTVAIPTAVTFTVTGTTSGTQFDVAGGVSVAVNTTDVGTRNCPYKNGAAQTIRITPSATPAANTGRVRVTIFYYQITAATS